ncbi:MAG: hypothetical protein AAFZ92_09360 [Pseudomonadota bacterium]
MQKSLRYRQLSWNHDQKNFSITAPDRTQHPTGQALLKAIKIQIRDPTGQALLKRPDRTGIIKGVTGQALLKAIKIQIKLKKASNADFEYQKISNIFYSQNSFCLKAKFLTTGNHHS